MPVFDPTHLVRACVDGAFDDLSACAWGHWAARRLDVTLELLHVMDPPPEMVQQIDLSGAIGLGTLGTRDALLEEMTALDERRHQVATEHGRELLAALQEQLLAKGWQRVQTRQEEGQLVEIALSLEPSTRLFVLGQHRPKAARVGSRLHLDHQVERVIRAVQAPVLVTAPATDAPWQEPARCVVGFDGSHTGRRAVERVAASPLLRDMPVTLVMAGQTSSGDTLAWAHALLTSAGFEVHSEHLTGEPEVAVIDAVQQTRADLLVIGAYGHSRIRHLIVGSTTTTLLRSSPVPVLVLR